MWLAFRRRFLLAIHHGRAAAEAAVPPSVNALRENFITGAPRAVRPALIRDESDAN